MFRQVSATFFLVLVLFLSTAEFVQAGFGITPPYFRNTSLTRNSVYEQEIILVRGDPNTALRGEITIDAPEIQDWITIVGGDTIPLPEGERKVPMTVRVQVPEDAEFKSYDGSIRIKTVPASEDVRRGAVNISLGAQVDIDLTVIDREIKNFRVRRVGVSDLNEGHKLGWLYFPGKIPFEMLIENTGNVDVRPTRVELRIYDATGKVLLEQTEHLNRLPWVEPFASVDMTAEIPTRLPAGSYIAKYRIYNGDDVKQSGELNLSILPYGTLQTAGFGFIGLSLAHKLSILLPTFTALALLIFFIYVWRKRRREQS